MKRFIFATLMLCLFSVAALAQTSTGRLVGVVSDASGVIQKATVVLKDNKTGSEKTTETNDQGGFTFGAVDVGTYTVTVTAPGHKTHTSTEVKIDTGAEYSLPVSLEVGAISENVTVVAGADIINSSNGEINSTIGPRQLLELPLLTRNPLALILTQPGSSSNPLQNTSINGQRTSFTNIVRDGINIQDNFIRSNATDFAPSRPSVDDVGEFTNTTLAGADAGFGGGQLTLSTPRGQNKFSGALFEFNRNSKFAANTFFNNALGTYTATEAPVLSGLKKVGDPRGPLPFRNRNQYGGKLSGPIIKNKLFFFGYYEGLRDVVTANDLTTTLTPGTAAGNFTYTAACTNIGTNLCPTGITPGQNVTVSILNPALGTGITTVDPTIASRFLSRLPGGNTTEAGDTRNTIGYRFAQASGQNRDTYTTRFDYDLNTNNSVKVVYNYVKEGNQRADQDSTFNLVPRVNQPSTNRLLSLGYVATPTPKLTNEMTGGFFKSVPVFLSDEPAKSSFFIVPTLITNPEVTFLNQGRTVTTTNFNDNASYSWGDHSFKFGGAFQNVDIDSFNDAGITPSYTLGINALTPQISATQFVNNTLFPGGVPAAQQATANSLLALLGGIVVSGTRSYNVQDQTSGFIAGATQKRIFNVKSYGVFFSDQWRATPSLTLNLGLRWDYYTPLKMVNGLALEPIMKPGQSTIDTILDPNGAFQFVGGNAGNPGEFYRGDKNNFAPILSFAWSPHSQSGFTGWLFGNGKTVVRGGFRMSYVNDEMVRAPDNALLNNSGLNFASGAINPATLGTTLNARVSALPAIPVPTFVANRTFILNNTTVAPLFQAAAFIVDPNLQTPRTSEFSFGVQRDIGWSSVLEVRYVGGRSNNLLRAYDANQVDIRGNGFLADYNRALNNCLLQGATITGSGTALSKCTTGAFNPTIAGSQPLTLFPLLGTLSGTPGGIGSVTVAPGGAVTTVAANSTILSQLKGGIPADLATTYVINALSGGVKFTPNPNIFVADELHNGAFYRYNALQVDLRRRFSGGLYLNANYTFEKELTNGQGTGQTRVEAFLDNATPSLEVARADYDQRHVFNMTAQYEFPFGKGKRFFGGIGNWGDRVLGGWQLNSLIRWSTGAPITVTDARGTLNRAGRSARQTALTNLTTSELRALSGLYVTPNGVFFFDPKLLGRNPDGSLQTGRTGRGSEGFLQPLFDGQVFFNNVPGGTSPLSRAIFDGPTNFNLDASLLKNIRVTESSRVQLRGELYNVFNHTQFTPSSQFLDINSINFGRITALAANPRIVQFGIRIEF
ncbi:MAG: hypothetical protein QOD75_598 [Blastocatellia bacterium]|jgi:hypothetical protein|nr:hypothetical protein [Blastocatellia bacterium]